MLSHTLWGIYKYNVEFFIYKSVVTGHFSTIISFLYCHKYVITLIAFRDKKTINYEENKVVGTSERKK